MYLSPNVRDNGLQYLTDNGTRMDMCLTEPTTYAEATVTKSLGNWTSLVIGAPADRPGGGRRVTVPANVGAGIGTDYGEPTYYAITDGVSELLVVNVISNPEAIIDGSPWSSSSFDIGMATEISAP